MQVWGRLQVSALVNTKRHNERWKNFDKNRCKLCDEITDPPHWVAMCPKKLAALKKQRAPSSSSSASVQQPTSESPVQMHTLAIKDMEQIVSLAACFTKLKKKHASEVLRKHDPRQRDVHEPRS